MAFREDISQVKTAAPSAAADAGAVREERYLFGPVIDFICLGGGSLILLALIVVLPLGPYEASIVQVVALLAFVINYPHFTNSYQIFYRNFARKAFGRDYDALLRARYINAGIVVPVAMVLFFVVSVLNGDARMLGLAANLMFLLVGWHYVKQGYGILMVDAVLKRQFFQDADKRILRINGYVVWFLSWLLGNTAVSRLEMLTLNYYTFEAPAILLNVVSVAAAVTGVMTLRMLVRRWRANDGSLPYNGVFAYIASLYFWILVFDLGVNPIWLALIPALHSLQYLEVVWRYQIGYERDRPGANEPLFGFLPPSIASKKYHLNMALFVVLGVILGAFGFWAIPIFLKEVVTYDADVFGAKMFMFIFAIFINVHHYFLDNVIWRRGNPDMQRYLFN